MQMQSDPIHGSMGNTVDSKQAISAEERFEDHMNSLNPVEFVTDPHVVPETLESIKVAEGITKVGFADPTSPAEMAKIHKHTRYHFADSDDEDDETVGTRKSLQTAEKQLKTRWFVNEKDEARFNRLVKEGKIRKDVLEFKENDKHESDKTQEDIDDDQDSKKAKEAKKDEVKKEVDAAKTPKDKEAAEAASD